MRSPQERRVLAILDLIRNREEMTDDDLVQLLRANLGIGRSSSATRAKRYRDRRRDVERDSRVTNVTPKRDDRNASTPPVPSPPLHSPSSLPPEIPKEIIVVSKGPGRVERRAAGETTTTPRNLEDALREPPAYRADLATRDPMLADLMQAQKWPDVRAVLAAWHEARGGTGEPKVTTPSRDGAVRAVLVLIGMGHLPSDLARVARHLARTEGFRDKASASVMTPEVVRIALDELDRKKPTTAGADLVRRVEAARGPQAVGDALKGLAVGGGT